MNWLTFIAKMDDRRSRGGYESIRPDPLSPLQWFVGEKRPRALLLLTKQFLADRLLAPRRVGEEVAFAIRYGLPTQVAIDVVMQVAGGWGSEVLFVGDLDPLDLGVFESYRRRDASLRGKDRGGVTYAGIDDRWLDFCERNLKVGFKLENLLIPMPRAEREHHRVLESMAPRLPSLIGPRSTELLRGGWKLEIEGATNPAFYRRGFLERLLTDLLPRIQARP